MDEDYIRMEQQVLPQSGDTQKHHKLEGIFPRALTML